MSWFSKIIIVLGVCLFVAYTQASEADHESCPSYIKCENGGTCVVAGDELWACKCEEAFYGKLCEYKTPKDGLPQRVINEIIIVVCLAFVIMLGCSWVFRHSLKDWIMCHRCRKAKPVFTPPTPAPPADDIKKAPITDTIVTVDGPPPVTYDPTFDEPPPKYEEFVNSGSNI